MLDLYSKGGYKSWSWAGKRKRKSLILQKDENPFLERALKIVKSTPNWNNFFALPPEKRDWVNTFDKYCNDLSVKYAWACPDSKAIRILHNFSPLIEIGAGRGYWAAMLQRIGTDIIPFDNYPVKDSLNWTVVHKGGPEQIQTPVATGRNLFLCYPDEDESIAVVCLENFKGTYVVHVGELAITDSNAGPPQAPYGRTSSSEFQIKLQQQFHCLLVADLQMRLPYERNAVSVWKRTDYVSGLVEPNDSADADVNSNEKYVHLSDVQRERAMALDKQYNQDGSVSLWKNIREEEMLPVNRAAKCLAHLLDDG